jgi:hypothetical protein
VQDPLAFGGEGGKAVEAAKKVADVLAGHDMAMVSLSVSSYR